MTTHNSLVMEPIGFVKSRVQTKHEAGHQPDPSSEEVCEIELIGGRNFELALQDLEGFDKIWLVWWFHKNTAWRPRVLPPRGPAVRRGVFATRSPHRPNPIGLTCVSLLRVEGLKLVVGPLDLLDGTPILDIKPYLTTVDCHPDSSLGWVAQVEGAVAEQFSVSVEPLAAAQLAWLLEEHGIDFTATAFRKLAQDPSPHRTRRILEVSEGRYRMSCANWRMFFRVDGGEVRIEEISPGWTMEALADPTKDQPHDRDAQLAFLTYPLWNGG